MFEVCVSGCFTAAHQLRLPDGSHEPVHGHEWRVKVTYAGEELDETGVLVDFAAVRERLGKVLAGMHERTLNELPAFAQRNPSAENVAVHIAEQMASAAFGAAHLHCVEVEEQPGCWARYRPVSRGC